jgi:hypothetical protein
VLPIKVPTDHTVVDLVACIAKLARYAVSCLPTAGQEIQKENRSVYHFLKGSIKEVQDSLRFSHHASYYCFGFTRIFLV